MLQAWLSLLVRWFPVAAVGLLALIFVWRRQWRDLPFFFLYLMYGLLFVAVLYVGIRLGKRPYFYIYWIFNLIGVVVVFLPMYEVFLRRLFTGFYKTRFYRSIFPLIAVLILVLTLLTALQAHDKGAAFKMALRAFDFMRTAVLVFFISLMLFMGRQWTRYDLGITLGFAIQAAVALANAAVRARVHYHPTVLDTVEIIAYNISCLIWLVTFWKPEKRAEFAPAEQFDREMLHQARTWETILKDWLTPGKSKR
jgi:hypothetical protein